jgi:hypothetical protein
MSWIATHRFVLFALTAALLLAAWIAFDPALADLPGPCMAAVFAGGYLLIPAVKPASRRLIVLASVAGVAGLHFDHPAGDFVLAHPSVELLVAAGLVWNLGLVIAASSASWRSEPADRLAALRWLVLSLLGLAGSTAFVVLVVIALAPSVGQLTLEVSLLRAGVIAAALVLQRWPSRRSAAVVALVTLPLLALPLSGPQYSAAGRLPGSWEHDAMVVALGVTLAVLEDVVARVRRRDHARGVGTVAVLSTLAATFAIETTIWLPRVEWGSPVLELALSAVLLTLVGLAAAARPRS